MTHRGTVSKPVDHWDLYEASDVAEVSRRHLRWDAELLLPIPKKSTYYEAAGHVKLVLSCVPFLEEHHSTIILLSVPNPAI